MGTDNKQTIFEMPVHTEMGGKDHGHDERGAIFRAGADRILRHPERGKIQCGECGDRAESVCDLRHAGDDYGSGPQGDGNLPHRAGGGYRYARL